MPGPISPIGRLTFEFQRFTFGTDTNRQRTTKVSGTLSHFVPIAADPPLAYYADGDTSHTIDASVGFDKGHLIMVSHSGVSAPENIVPMYPCFNQAGGIWREMELRVASYVNLTMPSVASPRIVDMVVEIEYGSTTDSRFPTAFLVTVQDTSASGGFIYFKGVAMNRMRISHLPTPPATINAVAELGSELVAIIQSAATHVATNGWVVESLYPSASPPILAPLTDVPVRPYAMLDFLWLVAKEPRILAFLTDGCTYAHRFASQFHERQKMLIRIVNAMYHGSKIKSDYPGDTTDDLIVGSGQRSAQIDHVFPYSAFGGNLFSNALVASGAYNNAMKASSPATKWADRSGATLYPATQHL